MVTTSAYLGTLCDVPASLYVFLNSLCISDLSRIMRKNSKMKDIMRNLQFITHILLPIIIFNFLFCENSNQAEEKNSLIEYARTYSGTESTRDWDDKYWDIIGEYDNVNSYNESMRLNREYEELIKLEKDYWNWLEYSHKNEYQKRRRELK